MVISSLTSEFGEPVLLPGGGFDSNPENDRNRVSRFISHIPILSIPEYEFPECDRSVFSFILCLYLEEEKTRIIMCNAGKFKSLILKFTKAINTQLIKNL